MIRIILALTIAGALVAAAARAQTTESEDSRYQFNRVEEGYLEVARRLGFLRVAGPRDLKGPETVQ